MGDRKNRSSFKQLGIFKSTSIPLALSTIRLHVQFSMLCHGWVDICNKACTSFRWQFICIVVISNRYSSYFHQYLFSSLLLIIELSLDRQTAATTVKTTTTTTTTQQIRSNGVRAAARIFCLRVQRNLSLYRHTTLATTSR
jgi:hypothetical protein